MVLQIAIGSVIKTLTVIESESARRTESENENESESARRTENVTVIEGVIGIVIETEIGIREG